MGKVKLLIVEDDPEGKTPFSGITTRSQAMLAALEASAKIGIKNLTWFPSASFPSQKSAIALMESGIIDHIEGNVFYLCG